MDQYLQLPERFSPKVAQAARLITAGAVNNYDIALRLQTYFRQFAYDLSVRAPGGQDPVLWFLQNRRGYCEQFSGAFAAMARSLGLPARVAVGFTAGSAPPHGPLALQSSDR